MLQFPRSRFSPHRSQPGFIYRFRNALSLGLAALLFCAPLSFGVSARSLNGKRTIPAAKKPEPTIVHNHPGGAEEHLFESQEFSNGYVIEMIGGTTTCRKASRTELQRMRSVDRSQTLHPVKRRVERGREYDFQSHAPKPSMQSSPTGLTINFRESDQLKNHPDRAKVVAAFQRAAAVWESRIKNPISIIIDIDYGKTRFGEPFCPATEDPCRVLGSTDDGSLPGRSFTSVRSRLLASASNQAETTLYNALPAGPSAPTNIGAASTVVVSRALARALGLSGFGPISTDAFGDAPSIGFNENFAFDFNPDDKGVNDSNNDGIENGKTDFDAVAVHEIGHALGFTSFVSYNELVPGQPNLLTVWDLFRFAPGVNLSSFPTDNRWLSTGNAPNGNPVFFNNMGAGLQVSTGNLAGVGGDEEQASHWKDNLNIGIMDPTISRGVRQQVTANDLNALETFGYNLGGSIPSPPPAPANDNFASAQILNGCSGSVTGSNVSATKESFEPDNPNSPGSTKSVWYQLQSPAVGSITIDTKGSDFDTVLAVYTVDSLGKFTLIANNDDDVEDPSTPEHDTYSLVTFTNNTPGTIYRISVNGFNNQGSSGDTGSIKLNWTQSNGCASPAVNPIDGNDFFVHQHYLDFLDREPDAEGFAYWTTILNGCGADFDCQNRVRVEISSRFFIELEFQRTGFYVMRLYQASYGLPPTFTEFIADRKLVQNNTTSQKAFAASWVQRSRFLSRYPTSMTPSQFVTLLYNTAGVSDPVARAAAEQGLTAGTKTRADVLYDLAERADFQAREYNPTFVRMQYYGYLRRDIDQTGYAFWMDVINKTNNYQSMICAFVNSSEYQLRFNGTRGKFTELNCNW